MLSCRLKGDVFRRIFLSKQDQFGNICFCWFPSAMLVPIQVGTSMASLYKSLYIWVKHFFGYLVYGKFFDSSLNLRKGPCIFTSFHFPDSGGELSLVRTRKFIPPPWYKGGGEMELLPSVFDMLQYFETILPLVESF